MSEDDDVVDKFVKAYQDGELVSVATLSQTQKNKALFAFLGGRVENTDEIIISLVDAGADPNCVNEDSYTPLHIAAQGWDALALLLQLGAKPAADKHGRTPLHFCAGSARVKTLLDAYPKLANLADGDGAPPFHGASEKTFPMFVAAGADLRAASLLRAPPGWAGAIILAGADPKSEKNQHVLLRCNDLSCADIVALINAGAPVNIARESDGETPLHRLATNGSDISKVQIFLRAGASANAKDRLGHTPLHRAACRGDTWCDVFAKVVIASGGNVNARTEKELQTPLHMTLGRLGSAKSLIDLGADVNAQDINGNTLLHMAAVLPHLDIAMALLDAGAYTDIQNGERKTPMDVAKSYYTVGAGAWEADHRARLIILLDTKPRLAPVGKSAAKKK